ncbi:uncharacterized protein GLRG_09337 [Colletotrichum graminicola M1.001]|uniref:Uncharacterized protein n=1 Tax=Colletotrichum graminicola (strain M1.001 / M2 / FGSC 10212) TaxID=645133 RepID=E3QTK5_COLGM|nr:uncharacterized protein GLRG_09337 [Colletotrichum graminicola M1.001]EFQ34193.1 hypothetical protein GLRG_09337 [Colletotrichum graminicola M1.001]
MKFSTAAFIALGFLAGNVVSAPTFQSNNVALPVEARANDFVANDAAAIAAREDKNADAKKKAAAAAAAKKNNDKNKNKNNNNNNKNKNNNNNNNAAAEAKFNGLACTNGKGAGTCNAKGLCTVNGKTAQIAGQCGIAAAAAAKAT